MKQLKFKTNINCMGCVNIVSLFLKNEGRISDWKVEINDPDKILTVSTSLENEEVERLIEKSGFRAKVILQV